MIIEPNVMGNYGKWIGESLWKTNGLSVDSPDWKEKARATLKKLLLMPDTGKNRKARIIKKVNYDGLAIEEVGWQLPYGPETRAFLLKPANAKDKLPGILAMHDHGGFKFFGKEKITRTEEYQHPLIKEHQKKAYSGRALANELAKRGYCVLVPDVFAFGSRKFDFKMIPEGAIDSMMSNPMDIDKPDPGEITAGKKSTVRDYPTHETERNIRLYNAYAKSHEHLIAKSLFSAGYTWPGVFLAEDIAALDYLYSREDIRKESIGCVGLSGGGLRTNYLAAMDERIKCSVTVGFMSTWKDFSLNVSYKHTWMTYIPGAPRYFDFPEILAIHAPLPAMVLATLSDPLYTLEEVKEAENKLRSIYARLKHPECFDFRYYEGPHYFNLEMQEVAFDWFDRWINFYD